MRNFRFVLHTIILLGFIVASGLSHAQIRSKEFKSVRSEHFIVSGEVNREMVEDVAKAAEEHRRKLALYWLGKELPPWREPCPIQCNVHPSLRAGGVTSFMFDKGVPWGWTMTIQGSRERVLDSVLPHEVSHMVFATHFGRPLPRWCDEGLCTTTECQIETSKQKKFLIQFLTEDRGIAFNKMFAMKEYPADILPLYSQGYSLSAYLLRAKGGGPEARSTMMNFIRQGMDENNWTKSLQDHYDIKSLSELQTLWIEWVKAGSPGLHDVGYFADCAKQKGEVPVPPNPLRGEDKVPVAPQVQLVRPAPKTAPIPRRPNVTTTIIKF